MPKLREVVTIPDQFTPTGLESYPGAVVAYRLMMVLRLRRDHGETTFTPLQLDGEPGWSWSGDLMDEVRKVNERGLGSLDAVYRKVLQFLSRTGNLVNNEGTWWIPDDWRDVAPTYKARTTRLRVAPTPEPEHLDLSWDPDQMLCRFCHRTFLTAPLVRGHERDDHPAEYVEDAKYLCPIGDGAGACRWPAKNDRAFSRHLTIVHGRASHAEQTVLARQGRNLALHLTDQPAKPAPAEPTSPVTPPPAPPLPVRPGVTPHLRRAAEPTPAALPPRVRHDFAAQAVDILTQYVQQTDQDLTTIARLEQENGELRARLAAIVEQSMDRLTPRDTAWRELEEATNPDRVAVG